MTKKPSFSVIMPLHNKRPHLSRSICSVLSQTFSDFELIVVDDASTDGGAGVVSTFGDPRIRLMHRREAGPGGYAARNLGASVARAHWLAFLDADDEWRPDHLLSAQRFLTDYPDVDFVFFGYMFAKGGEVFTLRHVRRERLSRCAALSLFSRRDFIHTNSIIVNQVAYQIAGGFPAGRCKRGGDSDLWVRLIMHAGAVGVSNEVTSIYQQDASEIIVDSGITTTRHPVAETVERILSQGAPSREERYYLKRISNRKSFQWSRARKRSGKFKVSELSNYYVSAFSAKDLVRFIFLMIPSRKRAPS